MASICEIRGIVTTNGKCVGLIVRCTRLEEYTVKRDWRKLAPDPKDPMPAIAVPELHPSISNSAH